MPSARTATTNSTGPHLNLAVICEKILMEGDGGISLIRIVDTLTQGATGPEPPQQMPPFLPPGLTIVVGLRADQAKGRFGVKIRPEAPSGHQLPPVETPVQLKPGPEGVLAQVPLTLPISEEGVYWFDVFLTGPNQPDRLLTRMPLEVFYNPQQTA